MLRLRPRGLAPILTQPGHVPVRTRLWPEATTTADATRLAVFANLLTEFCRESTDSRSGGTCGFPGHAAVAQDAGGQDRGDLLPPLGERDSRRTVVFAHRHRLQPRRTGRVLGYVCRGVDEMCALGYAFAAMRNRRRPANVGWAIGQASFSCEVDQSQGVFKHQCAPVFPRKARTSVREPS